MLNIYIFIYLFTAKIDAKISMFHLLFEVRKLYRIKRDKLNETDNKLDTLQNT